MVTCVVIGRWATLVNHSDLAGRDWSGESRLKYVDPGSDNSITGTGSNVMCAATAGPRLALGDCPLRATDRLVHTQENQSVSL